MDRLDQGRTPRLKYSFKVKVMPFLCMLSLKLCDMAALPTGGRVKGHWERPPAHAPQPGRSQGPEKSHLGPRSICPAVTQTELCSPCVSSSPDRGGRLGGEVVGPQSPVCKPRGPRSSAAGRRGAAVEAADSCGLSRGHPGRTDSYTEPQRRSRASSWSTAWLRSNQQNGFFLMAEVAG